MLSKANSLPSIPRDQIAAFATEGCGSSNTEVLPGPREKAVPRRKEARNVRNLTTGELLGQYCEERRCAVQDCVQQQWPDDPTPGSTKYPAE